MRSLALLPAALCFLLSSSPTAAAPARVRSLSVVNVACNKYSGYVTGSGVTQWLGMRYAAPPVGNLRFNHIGTNKTVKIGSWGPDLLVKMRFWTKIVTDYRSAVPPEDPPCNTEVQPAVEHGPVCLTTGDTNVTSLVTQSEDCLFIDVYTPTNATANSKLPVFFWIQGGGFNSNSNANYDGAGLIRASGYNMVVVTFNYRVGPYGFITNGDKIKPNNGLRDQRKALEWVHKYVANFGGDPGHVVLGGASAGAGSISLHRHVLK